ncbi:CRISPR-associated helicase Cas3' [Methanobacterium sp. BAmetb5]|uniref:CRISPR-associated helicase Cas3' n=1 Tax=Methanobacterium sp. BAmetb5 TaxID=2025351 RepID=UPI0025E25212|nr:CRISPR-associated helicase Cas3' [Methanobacterium sp. BAmetb5]
MKLVLFGGLEKKMSFSYKLKSHPEKRLVDHLCNVAKLSKNIVNSKIIENKDLISKIAYLNGISHDFGKSTTFFQIYIHNHEKNSKFTYHSFVSSFFGYYLVKDYLKKNGVYDEFWYLPAISWIVINKHHGNIKNLKHNEIPKLNENNKIDVVVEQIKDINKNHLDEINHIYEDILSYSEIQDFFHVLITKNPKFTEDIRSNVKKLFREKKLEYYFWILFFYSILLDADKLDASETPIPKRVEILEKDLVDQYKAVKFKDHEKINQIREMAYQEVNSQLPEIDLRKDRIFSINLPTGVGKTLTSFSFALGLQDKVQDEKGFNPKIIYSLPFLSIIDQNSSVISEILAGRDGKGWEQLFEMDKEEKEKYVEENTPSNLLLKHHHLIDIKYKEEKNNELNVIENINKSLLLTEGWHSEVVITTFIQFFHSLITNKNRAARKFHNMINSIIILDEIQAIPNGYWLLLNNMLKYLASKFNCWIILITATKPLIFDKKEIKELVKNRDMYFEAFDRVNFNFDLNEKDFDDFKEEIFDEIIEKKDNDIMVVLNTINSAKELYNHLKERLSEEYKLTDKERLVDNDGICKFNGFELINMTTHVLPRYRLKRIDRIKHDKKRKIIITTQLVEAGVDVSVDIIYRDLAPLDSIIQTAGRCNRNDEGKKGSFNTIVLKDENKRFHEYVYDSVLIDATKEIMTRTGGSISEKDFTMNAADEYYRLIKERGSYDDSRQIMEHLIRLEFSDTSKFQLIKNDIPKTSVFIEINEEAKKIREYMEEIQTELKRFERKNKLLEIKKDINLFTLSISCNKKMEDEIGHLPYIGRIEDYKYVPKKDLEEWYRLDVGFCPPTNDIDMRMI